MRKSLVLAIVLITGMAASAQLNPVSWSFSASKTGDKMYEVKIVATIQNKWHLYSQKQPNDAIVDPTEFKFNPNPLFSLEGKVAETGNMEKFTDKTLGISANQYSSSVVFTQKVKLKAKAKTNVTGSVTYQTCDDQKCLPPKTINFSIALK